MKSFGFANFSSGDAAQRALRLLNGVNIGGEELEVCNMLREALGLEWLEVTLLLAVMFVRY